MTRDEFDRFMGEMRDAFPEQRLRRETFDAYWTLLNDLAWREVAGLPEILRTVGLAWPTIAEIHTLAIARREAWRLVYGDWKDHA